MSDPEGASSIGKPTPEIRAAGRLTVYGLFAAQAARDPDAVAIEWAGAQRSYAALNRRVVRLAAALRDRGVGYGDRVALISENRCEYIEIELALAYLGAILACQNWRLAGPEM
jgi:acyl-CoA synthetase (AMP-forming)/AMP-acid ligase II